MKKQKTEKLNQNKGITLIVLVITIIVMLILVAVTISMAVNGGLFEYAGKATGETKNALKIEQELANGKIQVGNKWYASIDDYIKEKELVVLPEGIKVGDYVNYTPTTGTYKVADGQYGTGYTTEQGYQSFTTEIGENALQWRILSIDEETGEVELVSEKSAQIATPLYLQGSDGYNHAVDILNDLCKTLYSNTNGAYARSIKLEDIEAKITFDYDGYTSSAGFKYEDTKRLSEYGNGFMCYPNLYSREIGYGTNGIFNITGLDGSVGLNDGVKDANGITTYNTVTGSANGNTLGTDPYATMTHFSCQVDNILKTDLGINNAPSNLFNTGEVYYLASRTAYLKKDNVFFNLHNVSETGFLGSSGVISASSYSPNGDLRTIYVRPVVTLSSNLTLTKDMENSTEEAIYWNIEY